MIAVAQPPVDTQPFPKLDAPMVTPDGRVTFAWQQLLINLWLRVGGNVGVATSEFVFITQNGSGSTVNANGPGSGTVGRIELIGQPGLPAVPVVVGASPFVYTALAAGSIGIESGQVEFSRDHGVTWFVVGLAGGMVPVRVDDKLRVTYYNSAPTVTFFGD